MAVAETRTAVHRLPARRDELVGGEALEALCLGRWKGTGTTRLMPIGGLYRSRSRREETPEVWSRRRQQRGEHPGVTSVRRGSGFLSTEG